MPKVSVIVPVYNTEKYLRRCVDSILAQTFKDFELLLIDDGSTDSSPAILDEYANLDPHVRVFHQQNGGVSSARNLGLDNSKGEWISFIDSDDWVDKDYISNLINGSHCDLSISSIKIENSKEYFDMEIPNGTFNETQLSLFLNNNLHKFPLMGPVVKLFKTEIIQNNNLRFPNIIDLSEDVIFMLDYLKYTSTIYSTNIKDYHYWRNSSGLTSNKKNHHSQYPQILSYYWNAIDRLNAKYTIEKLIILKRTFNWLIDSEINYIKFSDMSISEKINNFKRLISDVNVKRMLQSPKGLGGKKLKILSFLVSHKLNLLGYIYII